MGGWATTRSLQVALNIHHSKGLEFAFETTATLGINEVFGGFAELQLYDCTGKQLVPSAWSNPDGNQDGYNNPPAFAFDGDLGTKWLDRNKQLLIANFK